MRCILRNLTYHFSAEKTSRAFCVPAQQGIPVHSTAPHANTASQTPADIVIIGGGRRRRWHSSKPKVIHRVRNKPLGIFESLKIPNFPCYLKKQKLNITYCNGSAEHSLGTTDLARRLVALSPSPHYNCPSLPPCTKEPSSGFTHIAEDFIYL